MLIGEKLNQSKNCFYELLMQFTGGTTPSRKNLSKHYSENLIDEAINLGYIKEIGKNDIGDPVYGITESGRQTRDN